ncbi:MAG: phage major capsid protein [Actinobacteria bacterium]|nr:phage major capsid protein [Actinomycetota bacterium]
MSRITELREAYNAAAQTLHSAADAIEHADESADLDALQSEFDSANDAAERARKELERMEAVVEARESMPVRPVEETESPRVEVVSNEAVYRKDTPQRSYFRDLYLSKVSGDSAATERLAQHSLHVATEARDNNTTDTTGGEFVPPLWLIQDYVSKSRAGRVTADLCNKFALPAGTDSINVPAITTGTSVAAQATQNTAVSETDLVTASVTAPVRTYGGISDCSVQLVEQSPVAFDQVIFQDLASAHSQAIDSAVINGTGASGTHEGILNADTINSVTYTAATPTVAGLFPKLADAVQQVSSNVFAPANAIVMHPRRWGFLVAGLDSSNRPLVVPNSSGPTNAVATFGDVAAEAFAGTLLGLPVFLDANIPTNLGSGTNEDRIIVGKFDEAFLYEGAPKAEVFRETLSAELTVRFRLYNFSAFTAERRPTAFSQVGGTGLATPSF